MASSLGSFHILTPFLETPNSYKQLESEWLGFIEFEQTSPERAG